MIPAPPRRSIRAPRGFTLVELLIVVMLLGVLAGIAAPRYTQALQHARLSAAAHRLAADLRRARSHALERATSVAVDFDVANDTYRSASLPDIDRPSQLLAVELGGRTHRVVVAAADFDTAESVTFDWRGDPASAGKVTLTSGDLSHVVTVNEAGAVEVLP